VPSGQATRSARIKDVIDTFVVGVVHFIHNKRTVNRDERAFNSIEVAADFSAELSAFGKKNITHSAGSAFLACSIHTRQPSARAQRAQRRVFDSEIEDHACFAILAFARRPIDLLSRRAVAKTPFMLRRNTERTQYVREGASRGENEAIRSG